MLKIRVKVSKYYKKLRFLCEVLLTLFLHRRFAYTIL
jgi:hypothetical protein